MNHNLIKIDLGTFSDKLTYFIVKLVNKKTSNIRELFPISIIPHINIWCYENIKS